MRLAALLILAIAAPAAAQLPLPAPPGPYVVDLRGATSGLPSSGAFYPTLPADSAVPARGYGFEAGVHVYPLQLGPARLGIGVSFARVRGTATGVLARAQLLAPQLSFNFGTARGWSYLSAGLGTASVRTEAGTPVAITDAARLRAINYGGGARWFVTSHAAVGFDVRLHRLAAGRAGAFDTPQLTFVAAAVGVSVR